MMKNITKKIVSLFLVALVAFSAGCSKKKGKTETEAASEYTYTGTHIYTAPDTDRDLVKDGKSDYTVVLPSISIGQEQTAKKEFLHLFQTATDLTLPDVEDGKKAGGEGLQHSADAKYISIGYTSLLYSSGIDVEEEIKALNSDGVRIKTVDDTVYIFGGSSRGTLYAVYTFMQVTFGFETYYKDCMEIDTNVHDLKLKAYDVLDLPDFNTRMGGHKIYTDNSSDYDENMYGYRMRMDQTYVSPWMKPVVNPDAVMAKAEEALASGKTLEEARESAKGVVTPGPAFHNTDEFINYKTSTEEGHGEWWAAAVSNSVRQLCYTAHGDPEEYELMIQQVAKVVLATLFVNKNSELTAMTFSIEDSGANCDCAACAKAFQEDGCYSGAMMRFVNEVARRVDTEIEKPENQAKYKQDYKLLVFAYAYVADAPVVKNKDGGYDPVSADVVPEKNVGVWLIPSGINTGYGLYDEEVNHSKGIQKIEGWRTLTEELWYWTYSTNFRAYMYLSDDFSFWNTDGYRMLASFNAKGIFNQSQHDQTGAQTAFGILKAYVHAKLSWDCNLDTGVLVENFFNAMYGDAAEIMKDYYYDLRNYQNSYETAFGENWGNKIVEGSVENKSLWPLNTLNGFMTKIDSAIDSIEKYKTYDPALYEKLYWHIEAEWFSPAFIAATLHGTTMPTEQYDRIVNRLKEDVHILGFGKTTNTSGSIVDLIENL